MAQDSKVPSQTSSVPPQFPSKARVLLPSFDISFFVLLLDPCSAQLLYVPGADRVIAVSLKYLQITYFLEVDSLGVSGHGSLLESLGECGVSVARPCDVLA